MDKSSSTNEQAFGSKIKLRIVKGGMIVLLLTILSSPVGYILRITLSKMLTAEQYGLFYALLGFFGMLALFNDLGFGYSVSYFIPKFIQKKNYEHVWLVYKYDQLIELGTSIIISIILFFSAGWLADNFFKVQEAKILIQIMTIYFVSNSFVSPIHKFYTGLQKPEYYSLIEPIRLVITLLMIAAMVFFQISSLKYATAAWALGYVAVGIIFYLTLKKTTSFLPKILKWDKQLFSKMLGYAVPSLLSNSLSSIISYVDVFLLTIIMNVVAVGVYSVAYPIAAVSAILLSPFQLLVLPLVSQLKEDSNAKVSTIVTHILIYIPVASLYFGLFTFMFASEIITLLFGSSWIETAVEPLKVLSIGFTLTILASFLGTVTSGLGRIRSRLRIISFIVIVNLLLSAVLIYRMGIVGVAFSHVIIQLITVTLYLKLISSEVRIVFPYASYMKLFTLSALCIAFLLLIGSPYSYVRMLVFGGIYTLFFFVGAFMLKIITREQIMFLFSRKVFNLS